MKKCPYCGSYINDTASFCSNCGNAVPQTPPPYGHTNYSHNNGYNPENAYFIQNNAFDSDPASGKSRGVMALLAIFIGGLGIQYFYIDKVAAGLITILLTIVTCGFWSIISLIQGIMVLCMDNRSFCQKFINSTSTFPLF